MKNTLKTLAAAVLASGIGFSAANAATINDDAATNFNGQYRGVGTAGFGFASVGGTNAISFDLFGANSVDGSGNGYDDVFTVILNGITVFEGLFNMSGGGANVVTTNTLGWAWTTVTNPGGLFSGGITSVSGLASLLGGANTLSFGFSSPGPYNGGNQGLGDESWALNKLTVSAVPLPAGFPLLLAGLAGIGALRLRKRQAA